MPRRPAASRAGPERPSKRDFRLCKVVLGAAISQILYARRGFPPKYFQVLPLDRVVSRSFEDIIASGSALQLYDRELLRDQGNTVFLRETRDYAVSRFLGILAGDIFPLLETEGLVKFRMNYLRSKGWGENCLAEYYTITFKYELDGKYEMDIRRAGTGKQHVSTTDSRLWNLGDYLSRLPSWTEPMHWTLAFHATERPDDPPIGVWKFDRTDFDDANLALQQQKAYNYERITQLRVMPLPVEQMDQVVSETSLETPDLHTDRRSQLAGVGTTSRARKGQNTVQPELRVPSKTLRSRGRDASVAGPSPSAAKTIENDCGETSINSGNADNRIARGSSEARRVAPRRKPKQPLQIFEDFASSLPATQIIGGSQSIDHRSQPTKRYGDDRFGPGLIQEKRLKTDIGRSLSPDYLRLLDGIDLSSDVTSNDDNVPSNASLHLPRGLQDAHQEGHRRSTELEELESPRRSRRSSTSSASRSAQWVPGASPPETMLGVVISENEEYIATTSEAEAGAEAGADAAEETLPRPPVATADDGIAYTFSPDTVSRRRKMLLYDLPSSDDDDD
ncbi:hypothetical protein MFIFM68171_05700 [Madurella fahalii]|uniref:HORMA domain-containing protein n=1 Tax=Madurella fahalii TaxID=1157608 RepID=A0ABQ0GCS6_9PEZI